MQFKHCLANNAACIVCYQWCHVRGEGDNCPHPTLNFSLLQNCLTKIQNQGLKIPHFGEMLGDKISILSTHDLLCQKFAAVLSENCNFLAASLHS